VRQRELLLDQNLSGRLLPALEAIFPHSSHVQLLDMQTESDIAIWVYAKAEGFAIVTKDADFVELSTVRGTPPKVIWLNLGNVSNTVVQIKLLDHLASIRSFLNSNDEGVFEIE
jgi:predicted nuclease of predicted toxin-antitoxin system